MIKIINFHLVNDIDWFERMICFLKSKYSMVSADDIHDFYQTGTHLSKSCHITVDDGDKTFYDIIFPVLKKHNVPATLFASPKICREQINFWFQEIEGYDETVLRKIIAEALELSVNILAKYSLPSILKAMPVAQIHAIIKSYQKTTGTVPKPCQNMTVDQLKEVDRSDVVTVGAHTMNHPILSNQDDASSRYEIEASVAGLRELLGHDIKYFAYPNGIYKLDFTEREEGCLADSGIQLTFTTEAKNLSLNDKRMRVPRIGVSNAENMLFLKTKLLTGSQWDKLKKLKTTGEFKERTELNRVLKGTVLA